jgi:hypothetical protein
METGRGGRPLGPGGRPSGPDQVPAAPPPGPARRGSEKEGEIPRRDRERDPGRIPKLTLAHCDAEVVNGSDRITSNGAPLRRVTPDGWLGNPALVSLSILTEASSWMGQFNPDRAG